MKDKLTLTYLIKGKGCLVVGGGKVGTRKVLSLLDQGITKLCVVSPEITPALQQLVDENKIAFIAHEFEPADVTGMDIVFAATPSDTVNRAVLEAGRVADALTCIVDKQWVDGDFISPATVVNQGVSVSVSTGGVSCRQSRMVRSWIARQLSKRGDAEIFVIGTDHHHLPLAQREPLHLTGRRFEEVGDAIALLSSVQEFMLLNTCNRVEMIGIGSSDAVTERTLLKMLGFNAVPKNGYYVLRGMEAFRHFALVTSGLLSQTPGENHITAQIKESCDVCEGYGWGGKTIREWLNSSLHLARHIRTAVSPLLKPTEIETLCRLYIDRELGGIEGKHLILIGTGMVGESVLEMFRDTDCRISWCYHHRVPEIPECRAQITLVQLNNLKDILATGDVIISGVSSDHPILYAGHAAFFDPDREIAAIDLSTPRNIASELSNLVPQMRLADLDDLKHWFRREACDMTRIMQIVADVLDEHTELYRNWVDSFHGADC